MDGAKLIIEQMKPITNTEYGGEIVIGRLITRIALYYKIDLTGMKRAKHGDRPIKADIHGLIKAKIIEQYRDGYIYIFKGLSIFPFLRPELTDIRNDAHRLFHPLDDVGFPYRPRGDFPRAVAEHGEPDHDYILAPPPPLAQTDSALLRQLAADVHTFTGDFYNFH